MFSVIVPPRPPSEALGVVHPANCLVCSFSGRQLWFIVSGLAMLDFQSRACGVAHPLSAAIWSSGTPVSVGPGGRLPRVPSLAVGVLQPVNFATAFRLTVALVPSGRLPVGLQSLAACDPVALPTVGVGQPASITKSFRFDP